VNENEGSSSHRSSHPGRLDHVNPRIPVAVVRTGTAGAASKLSSRRSCAAHHFASSLCICWGAPVTAPESKVHALQLWTGVALLEKQAAQRPESSWSREEEPPRGNPRVFWGEIFCCSFEQSPRPALDSRYATAAALPAGLRGHRVQQALGFNAAKASASGTPQGRHVGRAGIITGQRSQASAFHRVRQDVFHIRYVRLLNPSDGIFTPIPCSGPCMGARAAVASVRVFLLIHKQPSSPS
jgi:hypothetical protein